MSLSLLAGEQGAAWSFDQARERAAVLAKNPYKAADAGLPDVMSKLSYDQYQEIVSKPSAGPWHSEKLRFDLGFFPRGFLFKAPVKIRLAENGSTREFGFNPGLFEWGRQGAPQNADRIGYAGFKVLYRSQDVTKLDEVASFLGGSYFRIVGTRQSFGASARALAVDTGEPGGEEFPKWSEFQLNKPGALEKRLEIIGVFDSPSAAGACVFHLIPGDETHIEAEVALFPRAKKKFGLAPLTSMFMVGENRTRYMADFRPEVHDSDGLLVKNRTETLWRPLTNPEKKHRITRFDGTQLNGFGLLQRDRDFRSYEDLQARYDRRPSLWVTPLDGWQQGSVELVEIPTPSEYNDNIVAYWIPKGAPETAKELRLKYRLSALSDEGPSELMTVTATRITPGTKDKPPHFIIDFEGGNPRLKDRSPGMKPTTTVSHGEIRNLVVQPNEVTGGLRVFFDLAGAADADCRLQVKLESAGQPITETWVYDAER